MLNPNQWPQGVLHGQSAAMQRLRLQMERVAPHFRTALLVGETGCLKEQVARTLHASSPAQSRGFAVLPAASFRCDDLDRQAGATLFVVEIGDMHLKQQGALVTWLQQGVRAKTTESLLIFSTAVPPRGLVAGGRLLPELHNLAGAIEIRVPPLRERLEDLPVLLAHFAVTQEAMEQLTQHHWPGNLRELHEVMSFAASQAGEGTISAEHLPEFAAASREPEDVRLDTVLRRHVYSVLEGCAGNKLRAAEMLGISRSTLYRMLEAQ